MKKYIVRCCECFILMLVLNASLLNAQAVSESSFNYATTWRIIYFQDESQFVNQRPDSAYDPSQGFIFIFEILNKYVYQMQKFNQANVNAEMGALGIWAQLYLVNDVTYQELLIGDHTISDGRGWVIMNDDDYLKLSQLLLERRTKQGDPFDGNKEKALKDLSWNGVDGQHLDDFNTHFRIPKNTYRKENEPALVQPIDSSKAYSSVSKSEAKSNSDSHKSSQDNINFQAQITGQKLTAKPQTTMDEPTTIHGQYNESKLVIFLILLTFVSIVYYFIRRK